MVFHLQRAGKDTSGKTRKRIEVSQKQDDSEALKKEDTVFGGGVA